MPLKQLIDQVLYVTQCRPIDIERILELPFGYLDCVIVENTDPVGLRPLLECILAFPWLLRIADHNWDEQYAKKELAHQAVEIMFGDKK